MNYQDKRIRKKLKRMREKKKEYHREMTIPMIKCAVCLLQVYCEFSRHGCKRKSGNKISF